ncbi:TetR family transcriptional regulator [Mycobacterium sp. PS03-16]|uniref:TetR family transcriptional regulator n=1 Tax=Mycobacterium sp. PS03-16 TaxID=2559611 RepID=UPI001ADD690D|nr:TetR family transcriptional regulator [Mycobacterium sp. PS03-16]
MVPPAADGAGRRPGLRERKKQRTRATLIDAAVTLCLQQGYEATTVDQIAALADVSPRTFCRYFATKDAVLLTLLDGFVDAVSARLATIPPEVPALQALKDAHVGVLREVSAGNVAGLSTERIAVMLQIINSTPGLKAAASGFPDAASLAPLSARLGVPAEDRRLRLISAVWSAVIVTACGDLVTDCDGARLGPDLMADRIDEAWRSFATLTENLTCG